MPRRWDRKRIFVVASRPVTESGKTIRHIVIFDNHPGSLRLLLGSDLPPRRRNEFFYVVLAITLVLAAGLGMFWPLALSEKRQPIRSAGPPGQRFRNVSGVIPSAPGLRPQEEGARGNSQLF